MGADRSSQNQPLSLPEQGLSRRQFLGRMGSGGAALLGAFLGWGGTGCSPWGLGIPLSSCQRLSLRALWDAIVPGVWNGVVEDELAPGVPAPGADDAQVQAWFELAAAALPPPLDGFGEAFLATWADDLDLWADVVHGLPFDGRPGFAALGLGPSQAERGRQHKILLMQRLFHTLIDVKYQAGITLAKIAFYCDLYAEATGSGVRVGRDYIGFPDPPGTVPVAGFTYNRVLGDADPRLLRVGPQELVALP